MKNEQSKPDVSIILPVYNPGEYLQHTLASVFAQTYANWELFVVDDGSVQDVCMLIKHCPQTHYLRQNNQGQSVARNLGILCSSSKYVAFIDQDDLWQPGKLEKQIACMESNPSLGLCHTAFNIIDADGKHTGEGFEGSNADYLDILTGCGILLSTALVRRSCLAVSGLFDPRIPHVADYGLWLNLARMSRIIRIESCEASWRCHSSNDSGNYRKMYAGHLDIVKSHRTQAYTNKDYKAMKAADKGMRRAKEIYGAQAYDCCRASLKQKKISLFVKHFAFALRCSPAYVVRSILRHQLYRL